MLIHSRKRRALERVLAAYGRRTFQRAFARLHVDDRAWPRTDAPVIALLNHGAWGDPILAAVLSNDVMRRDGYGIMDGGRGAAPARRTPGAGAASPVRLTGQRA